MPYIGNQTAKITIVTSHNGVTANTVFDYGTEATGQYASPEAFCNQFHTNVTASLKALLASGVMLVGYKCTTTTPAGVPAFAPFFLSINENGLVAGESCPPYVSGRLYKVPDPLTLEATYPDPNPFRVGCQRIPGVAEVDQSQGIAIGSYATRLNAFGEDVESLDVSYGAWLGTPFDLVMIRQISVTQAAVVKVLETYGSTILGSQVSRKYSF